eukprot:1159996-Pelagomonas_calceolata.AAC.3
MLAATSARARGALIARRLLVAGADTGADADAGAMAKWRVEEGGGDRLRRSLAAVWGGDIRGRTRWKLPLLVATAAAVGDGDLLEPSSAATVSLSSKMRASRCEQNMWKREERDVVRGCRKEKQREGMKGSNRRGRSACFSTKCNMAFYQGLRKHWV